MNLFVMSWARVRLVCPESVSYVMFIGGGVCSILLFVCFFRFCEVCL